MLPCTGALIGDTTVKLFDSWRENGNLFFIGLAPSGACKTPACNIAWVKPLISHLEPHVQRSVLVDETSSNGLFNHFVNCETGTDRAHVPLLCIDEGYTFLQKLRILVLCQEKVQREMEEIEMISTQLMQESAVQSLGNVYEQIYVEHHQENVVEYTLRAGARELYYKYCKGKNQELSQSATRTFSPECNAKSNKNAIRLALINMHILWHCLDIALQQLTAPTLRVINETTMGYALTLHDSLLSFNGVAEACLPVKQGSVTVRLSVPDEEVKQRILTLPGPFCSSKQVYNSFSSGSHPTPQSKEGNPLHGMATGQNQ